MSGAAKKVHELFKGQTTGLTLPLIKKHYPELQASQISMALAYLRKQRYLSRELINIDSKYGRKNIWAYTYHSDRLPKEKQ